MCSVSGYCKSPTASGIYSIMYGLTLLVGPGIHESSPSHHLFHTSHMSLLFAASRAQATTIPSAIIITFLEPSASLIKPPPTILQPRETPP